jgi:hypothetical protein
MRIESRSGAQEEDRGPLTPWKEAGSRGLDTWFELPVGYAIGDGFGGEPGGNYDYLSLVKDYLAALEGEKAHGEYHAWLKHKLACLRTRR